MLEDRDYMREPDYGQRRWSGFRVNAPWTLTVLAVNVAVYIVEWILWGNPPFISENNYFALSVEGVMHGYVWQFLTFQFMHASVMHILLNSLTIFIFGRIIEQQLGAGRFLTLYFTSGIIGGVFQIAGGMLWPEHFGTAVVGASAGAMGLVTAFAALFPEQPLTIFLLFIPVSARAKYFAWGFALFSIICILLPGSLFARFLGGNVANGAHLGGMFMGWFYVKKILNRAMLGIADEERHLRASPVKPPVKSPEEFQEADVDAILDKISARGISSLTARERSILETARKKMAQR